MKSPFFIHDYLFTQIVNNYLKSNEALNRYLKEKHEWKGDVDFLTLEQIKKVTQNLEVLAESKGEENGIYCKEKKWNRRDSDWIDASESIVLACNQYQEMILLDYRQVEKYSETLVLASYPHKKYGQRYRVIAKHPICFIQKFDLGSPNILNSKLNSSLFSVMSVDDFDIKKVKEYIRKGANVNALNKDGHNILTYLLGDLWLSSAVYKNTEEEFNRQLNIVQQLLALGVNVNHIAIDVNCFHYVYRIGNYKLIKPLIQAGADPNFSNIESGATTLDNIYGDLITHSYRSEQEKVYWETIAQILEKYS